MQIKAISLWQPWASLIAFNYKKYETRSWSTNYRGKILICSAKISKPYLKDIANYLVNKHELNNFYKDWNEFPFGKAIAICNLTDCIKITPELLAKQSQLEIDCGNWELERYAWRLKDIKPIIPFPIKGKQKFFNTNYNHQ
ncbi:ASCH domain-containing protein [Geminocystis sp. GBBB08]|uniref:ASCH domain-containing protein n=1 Tax=Geminocystis sp. GBBB08 TaxID=2604140 RepID=UPI0027E24054|nr:ASCH domain-containing protein [Geminocystis sp. GBBB08]MBL1208250.1 ASCH domain-containing protein [Geminocystis sp. GBBB08]